MIWWEVVQQVWALNWWQALLVAIADDVIVAIKCWPFYVVMLLLQMVVVAIKGK